MRVAIIPARGGSRRIPRKNIRTFFGNPIIAYSIDAARESGLFDQIVVSTEDAEIHRYAVGVGATALWRPVELSDDNVGTQEVTASVIRALRWMGVARPEYVCCIYPCAPLMTGVDLVQGFAHLDESRRAYCYATNPDGADIGWFYWGRTWAFVGGLPLREFATPVTIGFDRAIDINTEQDWKRAEEMYARLHREAA